VSTLYAENFNVKSKKSNINIKHARGNGVIDSESGKINIGIKSSKVFLISAKNLRICTQEIFSLLKKL
jgi:hypothetical protein